MLCFPPNQSNYMLLPYTPPFKSLGLVVFNYFYKKKLLLFSARMHLMDHK